LLLVVDVVLNGEVVVELEFLDAVSYTVERHIGTLYHCNEFVLLMFSVLVERCYWNECLAEHAFSEKVPKRDIEHKLVVESDVVQD